MHFQIRPETKHDVQAIRRVQVEAFKTHPHSNQTEHLIVERMRELGDLALSLVAEIDGQVVGHIAFSLLMIEGNPSNHHLLGPLGVLPDFQRNGVGSGLIQRGVAELRSMASDSCVLFGDPGYYNRFYFSKSEELHHEGIPQHLLLELKLKEHRISGEVRFHPAFYSIA